MKIKLVILILYILLLKPCLGAKIQSLNEQIDNIWVQAEPLLEKEYCQLRYLTRAMNTLTIFRNTLRSIGEKACKKKKYDIAIKAYSKAQLISREIDFSDRNNALDAYSMAKIYIKQKKYTDAAKVLDESFTGEQPTDWMYRFRPYYPITTKILKDRLFLCSKTKTDPNHEKYLQSCLNEIKQHKVPLPDACYVKLFCLKSTPTKIKCINIVDSFRPYSFSFVDESKGVKEDNPAFAKILKACGGLEMHKRKYLSEKKIDEFWNMAGPFNYYNSGYAMGPNDPPAPALEGECDFDTKLDTSSEWIKHHKDFVIVNPNDKKELKAVQEFFKVIPVSIWNYVHRPGVIIRKVFVFKRVKTT